MSLHTNTKRAAQAVSLACSAGRLPTRPVINTRSVHSRLEARLSLSLSDLGLLQLEGPKVPFTVLLCWKLWSGRYEH